MIDKLVVDIVREVVNTLNSDCELMGYLNRVTNGDIKTINYQHGHYKEIANTLQEFNASPLLYDKSYPLIALFEDIRYTQTNGIYQVNLNLAICYKSEATLRSEDRYKEVINPVLLPLYEAFIKAMQDSGKFMGYEFDLEMITRPYYGDSLDKSGATKYNTANIFSAILDCIEIRNMKGKLYPNDCKNFYKCKQ